MSQARPNGLPSSTVLHNTYDIVSIVFIIVLQIRFQRPLRNVATEIVTVIVTVIFAWKVLFHSLEEMSKCFCCLGCLLDTLRIILAEF